MLPAAAQGGQSGLEESRAFAEKLHASGAAASLPLRILIYDRRNMGTSSIAFHGENGLPEEGPFASLCLSVSLCLCLCLLLALCL